VGSARRVAFAALGVAVRFAGVDLPVVDFLAVAFLVTFEGLLARTGRSLMACTSLSSDSPDTRPPGSGMDAVDGAFLTSKFEQSNTRDLYCGAAYRPV
jgi:hypothetical protein